MNPDLPIMSKQTGVFIDIHVRELLSELWTIDVQRLVSRNHLTPAREYERRKIGIVIEMVMREEYVVDLGGINACSRQLPSNSRSAIEQQLFVTDLPSLSLLRGVTSLP